MRCDVCFRLCWDSSQPPNSLMQAPMVQNITLTMHVLVL